MKTAINLIRIGAFLLFSQAVMATPQQLLTDLQHMRLAATNAITNFYMFSGLDADSKYERRIDVALGKFNASLASARELAAVNSLGDLEVLR